MIQLFDPFLMLVVPMGILFGLMFTFWYLWGALDNRTVFNENEAFFVTVGIMVMLGGLIVFAWPEIFAVAQVFHAWIVANPPRNIGLVFIMSGTPFILVSLYVTNKRLSVERRPTG